MKWLVRADGSVHIGTGHVSRCLTLARQADTLGVRVEFICRDLPGGLAPQIEAAGFHVHLLDVRESEDASSTLAIAATGTVQWLVVDHYGLDACWERRLRPAVGKILVIDDLADRAHDCDVLLDQNYWPNAQKRYAGLVPARCLQLLGPRYLLLREEFMQARARLSRTYGSVSRVLVNFGGADEPNATCLALDALIALGRNDLHIDIVIGASNPHREEVAARQATLAKAQMHVQASNMAELVAAADMAIGACGSSTWERCFLGLPTIAMVLADNQRLAAEQLAREGVLVNMGAARDVTPAALRDGIAALIGAPRHRAELGERSMAIMPATAANVAKTLLEEGGTSC